MKEKFDCNNDSSVSNESKIQKSYLIKGLFVWDRESSGPELTNIPDFDIMMYQELLCVYYQTESPLPFDLGNLMNQIEGRVSCIYGKHTLREYRRLVRVLSRFFVAIDQGYVPRFPHSRFINPETDMKEEEN